MKTCKFFPYVVSSQLVAAEIEPRLPPLRVHVAAYSHCAPAAQSTNAFTCTRHQSEIHAKVPIFDVPFEARSVYTRCAASCDRMPQGCR